MINKPQTDFFVEVTEVLRPRIWMELAQKLGYDVTSTAKKRNNFIMNFHITMLVLVERYAQLLFITFRESGLSDIV